jgi:hypothetical protein
MELFSDRQKPSVIFISSVSLFMILAGLAFDGLGEVKKAVAEFRNVLKLDPDHLWCKTFLEAIE